MIKEIHIYDLDGTLCNSEHRFRILSTGKIDLQYWREHCKPEFIKLDKPKPLAEQYRQQLKKPGFYVVIATARIVNEPDIQWIEKHLGLPHKLISRQKTDNRKGSIMKIAGLRYLKHLKQFANIPKWFYEDNKDYLYPVSSYLNATPIYCQSNQGV